MKQKSQGRRYSKSAMKDSEVQKLKEKEESMLNQISVDKIKKNTIASNFLQRIMGNKINLRTTSADNGKSNIKASRHSIRFRKGVKAVLNLIRIQEYKNILEGFQFFYI